MKLPIKWTYVCNVLPMLFYVPCERRKDFIRDKKRQMLCTMFEEHPAKMYEAIRFETQKNVSAVYEEIENCFKKADGRYIYEGNFVSREFLWQKFADFPFRIVMTVWVNEEQLESEENDGSDNVH